MGEIHEAKTTITEDLPILIKETQSLMTQTTKEEETQSAKGEVVVSPDSPCMQSTTAMMNEIARLRSALRDEQIARKTLTEQHSIEMQRMRKTIVDLRKQNSARESADELLVENHASLLSWYGDDNAAREEQYEVRSVADFECTYDIEHDDTTF